MKLSGGRFTKRAAGREAIRIVPVYDSSVDSAYVCYICFHLNCLHITITIRDVVMVIWFVCERCNRYDLLRLKLLYTYSDNSCVFLLIFCHRLPGSKSTMLRVSNRQHKYVLRIVIYFLKHRLKPYPSLFSFFKTVWAWIEYKKIYGFNGKNSNVL